MKLRKIHLGVLAAALVALGAFATLRAKTRPAPPAAPAPAVLEFTQADLYIVEPRALERRLPLTGTLGTLIEATVKAKVAGELVEVPVRMHAAPEGKSMHAGVLKPLYYAFRMSLALALVPLRREKP